MNWWQRKPIIVCLGVLALVGLYFSFGGYGRYDRINDPTDIELEVEAEAVGPDGSPRWVLRVWLPNIRDEAMACDCSIRVEVRTEGDAAWMLLVEERVETGTLPERTWTKHVTDSPMCGDLIFRATGEHHRTWLRNRTFTTTHEIDVPC